ncbi:MAG TPA: LysM peptidoglycan-binding domain-containing protein [Gaiellaceae bacterium]|nr:LysM peptidoglycan-binding domain-containing protein [Gaiellaceae bacterium]
MYESTGRARSISAIKRATIKVLLLALASSLVGVAVVATVTEGPLLETGTPADTPGPAVSGASTAPTSQATGACPAADSGTREGLTAERYRVRAGDTLWGIAARHYQDASAAMARIKRRSGLQRDTLLAGEVIVLPVAGRRGGGPLAGGSCPAADGTTSNPPSAP